MQLTEHFTLEEFTHSPTAISHDIPNIPSTQHIANLRALCENVLEPLRRFVDQPVIISSGYRCPRLNRLVGGVRNSQHMTGEAADIALPSHDANGNKLSSPTSTIPPKQGDTGGPSLSLLRDWFAWLTANTDFDQCILEHTKSGRYWIHVSYSQRHNRKCVISNILKK